MPDECLGVPLPADMKVRQYFTFDAFLEAMIPLKTWMDWLVVSRTPYRKNLSQPSRLWLVRDCCQMIVIIALMPIKEKRQIQGRFGKQPKLTR